VWAGAQMVVATTNQKRQADTQAAAAPLVEGYSQPARFAADVAQILFAAQTLAACPTVTKTGVVIGHYFAHLDGREHVKNPKEEARYVAQLRKWSQVHAADLQLSCLIIHDGIRPELLAETQHPNLEFVHVQDIPQLDGLR
jgi:hypothetical protein